MFAKEYHSHFIFHSFFKKADIFFVRYNWLGKDGQDELPYYVLIENRELTFYIDHSKSIEDSQSLEAHNEEDTDFSGITERYESKLYSKEDEVFLKIFLYNISGSYDQLNSIFKTHLDSDGKKYLARDMVLDFFWDLYILGGFTHSDFDKDLRLHFDQDQYYGGIIAKLCYYRLVEGKHPYDKKTKYQKKFDKNSLVGRSNLIQQQKSIKYYWKYLLDEKHETFFKYGMSINKKSRLGSQVRSQHWFNSLEDELKPILVQSKSKNLNFSEKNEYIKLSAKLLIKRYSLLDAIQYILPNKFAFGVKNSFLGLCSLILFFIIYYGIKLNSSFLNNNDLHYRSIEYDYLGLLLMLFIVGAPLLHFTGSTLVGKTESKYRLFVLFPQIYLPRLLIALCSGWLVFLTAEETSKVFDVSGAEEVKVLMGLLALLGGSMLVLMYNEIKSTAPSESSRKLIFRSLKIFMLGFIMSFAIGYLFAGKIFNSLTLDNDAKILSFKDEMIKNTQDSIFKIKINVSELEHHEREITNIRLSPEYIATLKQQAIDKGFSTVFTNDGTTYNGTSEISIPNKTIIIELMQIKIAIDSNEFRKHLVSGNFDTLIRKDYQSVGDFVRHKDLLLNEIDEIISIEKERLYLLERSLANLQDVDKVKQAYFLDSSKYLVIGLDKVQIINMEDNVIINHCVPFNQILNRALIALFLGVFLQLVIQDKTITEPI